MSGEQTGFVSWKKSPVEGYIISQLVLHLDHMR